MMHIRMKIIRRMMTKVFIGIIVVTGMIVVTAVLHICAVQNGKVENPQFTDGDLKMIMIDVGQGDSFLFLQDDKAMLVDAGPIFNAFAARKVLEDYNVKKLDYIVLTHYHQDHAAGLFSILFSTRVDKLYVTDMSTGHQDFMDYFFYRLVYDYMNFVDSLTSRDIVTLAKENGKFKDFTFSRSSVHFLSPIKNTYDIINNYSLCFKMTYGKIDFLMTGDIQSEVEEELLKSGENLSCEIYKAAHHGSNTSNTESFIDRINPKFVLISSSNGKHNMFGHPTQRFVNFLKGRGIKVLRTDEGGTISLYTNGKKIFYYPLQLGDYKSGKEVIKYNSNIDEAK